MAYHIDSLTLAHVDSTKPTLDLPEHQNSSQFDQKTSVFLTNSKNCDTSGGKIAEPVKLPSMKFVIERLRNSLNS